MSHEVKNVIVDRFSRNFKSQSWAIKQEVARVKQRDIFFFPKTL